LPAGFVGLSVGIHRSLTSAAVETALTVLAALAATGFAIDLGLSYRRRPRPHAGIWALAMTLYAIATWSLAIGLGAGWEEASFKSFYYFGAIANIPLLAAGSVHLNASPGFARRFTIGVAVFLFLGAVAVLAADVDGTISTEGVPEGSSAFGYSMAVGEVSLPGPRLFAAIAGSVGTVVIIGFALAAVWRTRRTKPNVALGNVLIVLGTLAPAMGGSLTALGEAGGLALSLLAGAVLLWSGYRVATRNEVSLRGATPG
jgi:hypothetical protein